MTITTEKSALQEAAKELNDATAERDDLEREATRLRQRQNQASERVAAARKRYDRLVSEARNADLMNRVQGR